MIIKEYTSELAFTVCLLTLLHKYHVHGGGYMVQGDWIEYTYSHRWVCVYRALARGVREVESVSKGYWPKNRVTSAWRTSIQVYLHIYMYTHIHVRMYICICIYVYIYTCIYMYTYMYINNFICIIYVIYRYDVTVCHRPPGLDVTVT